MRYYQHGSLDKFVTGAPENKPWDSQTAMEFACDIAHGLEAMHQAGFVHCDIKVSLRNLLLLDFVLLLVFLLFDVTLFPACQHFD